MTPSCHPETAFTSTPPGKGPASPPNCTSTPRAVTASAVKDFLRTPGSTASAIGWVNRVSSSPQAMVKHAHHPSGLSLNREGAQNNAWNRHQDRRAEQNRREGAGRKAKGMGHSE